MKTELTVKEPTPPPFDPIELKFTIENMRELELWLAFLNVSYYQKTALLNTYGLEKSSGLDNVRQFVNEEMDLFDSPKNGQRNPLFFILKDLYSQRK